MKLIVIQSVVSILLALFLKTCTMTSEKGKVPNIVPIALIILGLIPIVGTLSIILSSIAVGCCFYNSHLILKDNKFTRFLFGTK